MNQGKHTVSILKADGSIQAVSHWDRAEDALAQFIASLRLAGHAERQIEHCVKVQNRKMGQDQSAYEVLNPDFQGSVRISAVHTKGV